jgi:cytochrome c peroxidase
LTKRIALGKLLFYDPVLSTNLKRSCSSCHRPQKAFTDHRRTSLAYRFTNNLQFNAPTLLNTGQQNVFFHDGRAKNITEVIDYVIENPNELNCSYDTILSRLNRSAEYKMLFQEAFLTNETIQKKHLTQSLHSFVGSLKAMNGEYDRWKNNQKTPNQENIANGLALFENTGQCITCHGGLLFGGIAAKDKKIPSLRNVALTPPYFYDGQTPTLHEAIQTCYRNHVSPQKSLNQNDISQLVFFLESLSDTLSFDKTEPTHLPFIPSLAKRQVGSLY